MKRLVAENVSFHVWLDHRTEKPRRVPDEFRHIVRKFEGDNALITLPATA
jgi:acyl-CoA thioesterase FadM